MKLFTFIALFFHLIANVCYCAQYEELKFSRIKTDDGLSHNKVNCVFQDSRGFIWIGTDAGLNRYNGYNFTVFERDPENSYSLSANLIRAICEDDSGYIWIGMEAGGLDKYDPFSDNFIRYTITANNSDSITSKDVNSIFVADSCQLWLGTENGLELFDQNQSKTTLYQPYPLEKPGSEKNKINVVFRDIFGFIWVGTVKGGLCQFDPAKRKFNIYSSDINNPSSISDNEIRSIYQDDLNRLWIGTYSGGLNLYDYGTETFTHIIPVPQTRESRSIKAIFEDRDIVWLGTRSGLYLYSMKDQSFTKYEYDPQNPTSISQNNITDIFKDKKGDIWVSTWNGINYLNTNNRYFHHINANKYNNRYLNNGVVHAILEDQKGNLWFGTEEGGLNYYDTKKGVFTYYTNDPTSQNCISSNNIKCLIQDRFGKIWIGTYQGGLNIFDPRKKQFIHYKNIQDDSTSLPHNDVFALLEDFKGTIWVGTRGAGLAKFNKTTSTFERIILGQAEKNFSYILQLYEEDDGIIWIASNEGRVCRFTPETGTITHYKLPIALSGIEVRSIYKDAAGNMWFGTIGGGLHQLNPKTQNISVFTTKDGLPSNIIHGIIEDEHNNLWLSTEYGLCKFNSETKKVKNFYKENGLQDNQFVYNAHLKLKNGEFLFGGINGVTAFFPDSVRLNTYTPPVVLTDFKILNKSVVIGADDGILKKHINYTRKIELSHKYSSFTFEFAALNYANSQQNLYAYKMEGFEDEWNEVGTRRFATYTNLSPGDYVFRVKGSNNDGMWNDEGVALSVSILPPFYRTIWFNIGVVIILIYVIYYFIRFQHQKRDILRATALAQRSQLKLLRNQMNPHFLFNSINSIRSLIHIDKNRAWHMITELSEFFRYSLLNFNKVLAPLDEEIEAVNNYLNIEKIRFEDSLVIKYVIDEAARRCIVPAFLFQPLIENAIKFGMKTSIMPLKIDVLLTYKNDVLSIDVSNSGKMYEQPYTKDNNVHGTSLENIKERLALVFENKFDFKLFEKDGWVHAKIRIQYQDIDLEQINTKFQADDHQLIEEMSHILEHYVHPIKGELQKVFKTNVKK